MPNHWISAMETLPFADKLPFVALVAGRPSAPLFTRLMETAIMSIVAGAVGVYVGVEVIKNDLLYLKQGVAEVNDKIEKLENRVEQIRGDLYVPRGGRGS